MAVKDELALFRDLKDDENFLMDLIHISSTKGSNGAQQLFKDRGYTVTDQGLEKAFSKLRNEDLSFSSGFYLLQAEGDVNQWINYNSIYISSDKILFFDTTQLESISIAVSDIVFSNGNLTFSYTSSDTESSTSLSASASFTMLPISNGSGFSGTVTITETIDGSPETKTETVTVTGEQLTAVPDAQESNWHGLYSVAANSCSAAIKSYMNIARFYLYPAERKIDLFDSRNRKLDVTVIEPPKFSINTMTFRYNSGSCLAGAAFTFTSGAVDPKSGDTDPDTFDCSFSAEPTAEGAATVNGTFSGKKILKKSTSPPDDLSTADWITIISGGFLLIGLLFGWNKFKDIWRSKINRIIDLDKAVSVLVRSESLNEMRTPLYKKYLLNECTTEVLDAIKTANDANSIKDRVADAITTAFKNKKTMDALLEETLMKAVKKHIKILGRNPRGDELAEWKDRLIPEIAKAYTHGDNSFSAKIDAIQQFIQGNGVRSYDQMLQRVQQIRHDNDVLEQRRGVVDANYEMGVEQLREQMENEQSNDAKRRLQAEIDKMTNKYHEQIQQIEDQVQNNNQSIEDINHFNDGLEEDVENAYE